jgi:hypothetical protein
MNSEQNVVNTEPYQENQDTSGLIEIQQALEEIEKLQNNQEEEIAELEEPEEEQEEKVAQEEDNNEKHEKKESKIWKEKKRKYQAIAEKEALFQEKESLFQENLQLKQMLSESLNSGTYHYGKSAYADLERAKESKKRAIEEGDLDSLLEADISLTKAIHTINDLEKWAYTEEQKKPVPMKQNNDYVQSENTNTRFNEREQEIAKDWLEDHQYLDPYSPQYDVNMANKVANFISDLDINLNRHGNEAALFSDEYFEHIDNYISKIKKESPKNSKSVNSMAPVGAVRNSYTSSVNGKASSPTQMILTADEKRMCANSGISEKEWLKYKLEDLKKGK